MKDTMATAFIDFSNAAVRSLAAPLAGLNAILTTLKAMMAPASAPAIAARPAHCSNIMTLLAHLCDMDDELHIWVLRWLAYPLRNPGAKMSTALVFNGGEGSGKSLFLNFVVAELYGNVAARIQPRDLHSVFNGWIEGISLTVVDGEFARSHITRMKEAMAAESFVIERKGQLAKRIPNRLNFIYVTSSPDFLPADIGSRRFTVIEVPPARQRAFYQAVVHEIFEGGADAFREYLMHGLDMGTFNESTLPPASVRHGYRSAA
jgi:hypothetical protein